MKKKVTILMLGGAKRVSLARLLKEAGRRRGVEVVILSYEIIPTVPIACEGRIIAGRRWRDADALDHLAQTVADEAVDIVLPFVDGAIEVASRLKERCPQENTGDSVFCRHGSGVIVKWDKVSEMAHIRPMAISDDRRHDYNSNSRGLNTDD